MPLDTARSIDELATAVSGADIVLSTEAPLTLALDRRATQPRIGRVAATPRSHASGELVPNDRRPLFRTLVTEAGLSWKTAAWALDLTLDCWDRTGHVEGILDYPEFNTPAIQATVNQLKTTASTYQALATTQLSATDDIRVIDGAALTALDRQLLPDNDSQYTTVSAFKAGETALPEAHLYQSATAIVDAVVDQLSAANADRVGIVLDESTPYSSLLEAALEAEDIPYQGGPGFIDDDEVRIFLRLLQTCFAGDHLTVADVRPLLTAAGWPVSRSLDEQRLPAATSETPSEAFEQFAAVREAATDGTFEDALETFESVSSTTLTTLRDELEALNALTTSVTEQRLNDLIYYIQSFEIPIDRESDGVLLTDAASTAYVDRPVVFYLGLGEGWAKTPPDYPWVDTAAFTEQDLQRFQLLLQNGRKRYILAQEARAGDEVTPCPYLKTVLGDTTFETLQDLPDATHHSGSSPSARETAFREPSNEPDPEPVEVISQSSLQDLVVSPRDYYFGQLLATPTNYYMKRGTLLHDAAELYVNAPGWFTDADRRERLLDEMVTTLRPFVPDASTGPIRTRLDIGLEVIEAYLEANELQEAAYDTYDNPQLENSLADALGASVTSPLCERWFESPDLGGRGVVDLLQDPQTLVDYKSGSVNSAKDIQKKAAIDEVHAYPDFQVVLYLAQHRRERPGERLEMRFVHLLGAVDEMMHGNPPDLEELVSTLTYVPQSFPGFVASRAMYDQLTDYAPSNDRCKVLESLGFERYQSFFESHHLPREETAPDERAAIKDAFRELAKREVGDHKYVTNGVDLIFSDLTDPVGYFLKDDLDAFERFLTDRITDLNDFRESRFPVSYDDDEPNWDRVDHRDCILTTDD